MKVPDFVRTLLAFVLSPLIGLLTFLIFWIGAYGTAEGIIWSNLARGETLGFLGGIFIVGALAEAVLGIPLLRLLIVKSWLSWSAFAGGGFLIGCILLLIFYWGDSPGLAGAAAIICSATVASVFFGYASGWINPSERRSRLDN